MRAKRKCVQDLRDHFTKRWFQRYPKLPIPCIDLINKNIQAGKLTFVAKQSITRTLWKFRWYDKIITVVYNKNLNCVTTVLPEGTYDE